MPTPITITDKTLDPQLVTDGQSLAAYKGVSVADTDALSTSETVTITLSQSLRQTLGLNYGFYPTTTNFGSITDPNGGGTWNAATNTFTESGVVGGDPTFATDLLGRLLYNAPTLPNGQSFATQATITVTNSANTVSDITPVIVADVAPPAITGTVANEPIASGNKIPPFATVNISEPYFNYDYYTIVAGTPYNTSNSGPSYYYSPKDSVTITVTDGGKATDADGLLTGPGLSKTGVGTYSLGPDNSYSIEDDLRGLSFQTVAVAAGQTESPAFELDVTDTSTNLTTKDTITSLLVSGPTLVPVSPTIAGTQAGQSVSPGNLINPFASVTISDANPTPMDSATITLTNGAGQATDVNGTLTGTGLIETAAGSGVYTLAAATSQTLTSELDALTFHPTALPTGVTSETTGFSLAVADPVYPTLTRDTKTTVAETPKLSGPTTGNFDVQNETTGESYFTNADAYIGPVSGLTDEIILATSDNINITAEAPNVFISLDGGVGEDGINVSAANGNNVLNGSTGSSFLQGGTGNDTFFVDDRSATVNIWSTVAGFHSGDNATIWGITQAGFTITTSDNQGAAGFTGLTWDFTAAGQPDAKLSLAGYTTADLTNGKLSVSFGTTASQPGLPGSNYMLIHDN